MTHTKFIWGVFMVRKELTEDYNNGNDKSGGAVYNKVREENLDKRICSFDQLPLFLNVKEVKKILGLCSAKVYELFHSEDFPSKTFGRRLLVSRSAFGRWMENQKEDIR